MKKRVKKVYEFLRVPVLVIVMVFLYYEGKEVWALFVSVYKMNLLKAVALVLVGVAMGYQAKTLEIKRKKHQRLKEKADAAAQEARAKVLEEKGEWFPLFLLGMLSTD